ncbi:MAG: serine hydrolase domain-containing protein [Candidatus Hermodarchaeia archaeon]|jgi:CubicO group peptidase (beta-lactamase class C family)
MNELGDIRLKKPVVTHIKGFLLVMVICTSAVFAQELSTGPVDPIELEAFMDGYIGAHLEAHHIAGATVSVVKDGDLFFAKGYGYANINEKKDVKADETLFRIGSISKLFVWTAIMQLVEQGKLDLNSNINRYLSDFKIPDTYDEPVTLANLMTHTAGFEEYVIGLFARDKERLSPLGEILTRELPARVRLPGDVASYSNHGTGIAAYIVEQISGLAWDDYVEQNILAPLGMEHTTFRQPVPEPLSTAVSRGYSYGGGEFHEEGFIYIPLAPVGAASATATDMANFMIAHLQLGQFGKTSILDSTTARQMQGTLFRHTPDVNPMSHGFIDMSMNGQWVIGHGGNTLMFHSIMALLPEHKVGLFVSYNSKDGGIAVGKVYESFMNRYYPAGEVQTLTPAENAKSQLRRFEGSYRANRYAHRRLTKLGSAFGTVKVILTEEGTLKTIAPGETTRWIETDPLTFREEDGLETLAFREDEKGRITHMFLGKLPMIAFERILTMQQPALHLGFGVVAVILFLITVVFWPVAALIRRKCGVTLDPKMCVPFLARMVIWITCVLFVVFGIGLAIVLSNPTDIVYGVPLGLKVLLVLPILAAVLTLGALVYTAIIWRSGKGRTWRRIYYTVITLMCIAVLWQLNHWNLLGFRY